MNSHNKPAQKAIHANNQPIQVAFHSVPGLSNILQAVGFEMDVAQLSRGRLEGSFRLGGSRQLPVLSIQTNQGLLLQGNRRPGVMPLSLNTNDQQPLVRGKETQSSSLHGFQTSLTVALVQLPAGTHIQVALISQTRFEQLATATGDHQTIEVIQLRQPPPAAVSQDQYLIQVQMMGGDQNDLLEVASLEALSPHQLQGRASGELGVGAGLMKDLVAWGFQNTGQAITLNDLSPPEVQQTSGGNTVHEIACHYGFQSRNQFGESPSATLQRASAPGMSIQSVSVAQSPQMAMALR